MSDDNKEGNVDIKRLREHCDKLVEHFDSVQIFCTRHDNGQAGGTVNVHYGAGDYFSRYGFIVSWCIKQDERTREEVRSETDSI